MSLKRTIWLALHRALRGNRFRANGVEVLVPPSVDQEVRYLLLRGRPYERAEALLARKGLARGMHVLELGGSLGVISAVVRSVIGPEARHVIVEANADLAAVCSVNAAQGAVAGASTVLRGAVDYSGAATVTFDSGHNAHTGHVDPTAQHGVAVPTLTATAAAESLPAGPIALVCDIEGAEYPMVMQDAALLARLSCVIMEIHPPRYADMGGSTGALLAQFAAAGLVLQEQVDDVILLRRES